MQASGSANCPAVSRLLAAENRYGQTVLHIAARKGCRELLQLLLVYGAGQVAGRAVDAAGDTPLDIARYVCL
jgi:ankyrin repeat protein